MKEVAIVVAVWANTAVIAVADNCRFAIVAPAVFKSARNVLRKIHGA
jgi:hypothetical protein